jgi:hypothetical protein
MTMHARSNRVEQLITAFADTSEIGFAILDNELRYQMINTSLAGINRVPRRAHLGVSVGEIFGDISRQIAEPHYQRVMSTGLATHFEVANQVLPTRENERYWGLNTNLPIWNRDGSVKQIGIFVVEITEERKLQRVLRELSGCLDDNGGERPFWYARKVQDCLDKYYEVLGVSFEVLFRTPTDSMEQLVHSVEALDSSLAGMKQLVSEISASFPIDHD